MLAFAGIGKRYPGVVALDGPTAGESRAPIAGGTTLEISGGNFKAGAQASIAGVSLPTTFLSQELFKGPDALLEAFHVRVDPQGLPKTAKRFNWPLQVQIALGHAGQCTEVAGIKFDGAFAVNDRPPVLGPLPVQDRTLVVCFCESRGSLYEGIKPLQGS